MHGLFRPAANVIDRTGAFPRAALDALGETGLLGLISANEVGSLLAGWAILSVVLRYAWVS